MTLTIPILYEDAELVVIDKPIGLSVVTEDEPDTASVRNWVKERYTWQPTHGGAEDEFEQRLGIVHRLDKETSGLLVLAKTKEVFDYLKGLFKYRRIHKEYQALAYGAVTEDSFEISAPIHRAKNNGLLYCIHPLGRQSTTAFWVVARPRIDQVMYSYLKVVPKTGRTHQIRVHLKALGHPVVNDRKYAPRALLSLSQAHFPRMMLHAKRLTFVDWQGKERVFESPTSLL
jgi:23S rRNA pseudouridine1911/1915/1917 synthase